MKIVHISFSDNYGGAAIAAFRHCEAMRRAGHESSMVVLNKQLKSKTFINEAIENKFLKKVYFFLHMKIINWITSKFRIWGAFSFPIFTVKLSNISLLKEADLIYLHWIAASMLSTKEVENILKLGKPTRWYMHDMNPITGGCHYSMECVKYMQHCQNCPMIQRKLLNIDLAKIQFDKRLKLWSKYKNLEAYTPSNWLAKCVSNSNLWKGHKITVYPNVIDTQKFHPVNKSAAKDLLGIGGTKKLILFGAADVNSPYKGWEYMRQAINKLEPERYEALIFGEEKQKIRKDITIKCHFVGHLADEYSLILVYNAADVFVSASLADNYPNVIMEAMACGLPCVGFNIGGIPDQIKHKKNGFLADYKDSQLLAEGIKYVCECPDDVYNSMRSNARDFVCSVASYDKYNNNI